MRHDLSSIRKAGLTNTYKNVLLPLVLLPEAHVLWCSTCVVLHLESGCNKPKLSPPHLVLGSNNHLWLPWWHLYRESTFTQAEDMPEPEPQSTCPVNTQKRHGIVYSKITEYAVV